MIYLIVAFLVLFAAQIILAACKAAQRKPRP